MSTLRAPKTTIVIKIANVLGLTAAALAAYGACMSSTVHAQPRPRVVVGPVNSVEQSNTGNLLKFLVPPRTALVLSGGGARGSFEVGAIRFLYQFHFRPDIIVSTSVGSINGAKLAEASPVRPPIGGPFLPNTGNLVANAAADGLSAADLNPGLLVAEEIRQLWLGLRANGNMYLPADWWGQFGNDQKTALNNAVQRVVSKAPDDIIKAIRSSVFHTNETSTVQYLLNQVTSATSIYTLDPIRQALLTNLSNLKVKSSGTVLRLGTVALESGKLRYVTEKGTIVERDAITLKPITGATEMAVCSNERMAVDNASKNYSVAIQPGFEAHEDSQGNTVVTQVAPEPGRIDSAQALVDSAYQAYQACLNRNGISATSIDLIPAVLASSAIPVIFQPVTLSGETYVDGGVRSIIPVEGALALGATRAFAIATDVPDVPPWTLSTPSLDSPTIAQIGERAVTAIMTSEDVYKALHPPAPWPLQLTVIQPTTGFHDSLTIDPTLIRIAMDYGYMRAADVSTGVPPERQDRIKDSSDLITTARHLMLGLEAFLRNPTAATKADPFNTGIHGGFLNYGDAVTVIRKEKATIQNLVCGRWAAGVPAPPDVESWWLNWEFISLGTPPAPTPWQAWRATPPALPPLVNVPAATPPSPCLIQASSGQQFVVVGGAKIPIPPGTSFSAMNYDPKSIAVVSDALLKMTPDVPIEGTLLQELNDPAHKVLVMYGGLLRVIAPNQIKLLNLDPATIRTVPPGSTKGLPHGPS